MLSPALVIAQPENTVLKAKKHFENGKSYKAVNLLRPFIVEDTANTYALTYAMMANIMCPNYRLKPDGFMLEATRLYIKAAEIYNDTGRQVPKYAQLTYERMEPFYDFLDHTFYCLDHSGYEGVDFENDVVWDIMGLVESVTGNSQFRMDYYESCLEYGKQPQNLRDTSMYEMMKFAFDNSPTAWGIFKGYYEQDYRSFEMEDGSWVHALNYQDTVLIDGAVAEYYPYIDSKDPYSFATVVHESTHRNNYIESPSDDGLFEHLYAYFTTPKGMVKLRVYDKLNSIYLKDYLPKSLTDSIFRFNAYIANEGNNMSSQVNGLYGLLDEMCAYYHEAKALWEAKDAYNNSDALKNALAEVVTAFYEFQFFTNQYLKMIEEEYSWALSNLRNDNDFRIAFTFIYDAYKEIVFKAEPYIGELDTEQSQVLAKTKSLLSNYSTSKLEDFLFPLALQEENWRQYAKYNDNRIK